MEKLRREGGNKRIMRGGNNLNGKNKMLMKNISAPNLKGNNKMIGNNNVGRGNKNNGGGLGRNEG
jgi:hypothetical protein